VSVPAWTVARVFLQLGLTAFGGPAAHMGLMHEQVVARRKWIDDSEFADLMAASNLIPGPNSTELALHIGRRVAGWPGFFAAGAAFVLPAAAIVAILAVLYVRYGQTPDAQAILVAVIPVIIAVIAQAVWTLARATLNAAWLLVIAAASLALSLVGFNELLLLAAGGVAGLLTRVAGGRGNARAALALALSTTGAASLQAFAAVQGAATVSLAKLTLVFLKIGSILFGSGYVLVAFLRRDFVERYGWLTDQQLLDAIAVGQITPGPLSSTATFIGYVLAGAPGAVLATLGMFLPAFVFVAITQPLIAPLRRSATAGAALDGVVAASLGLMTAVAVTLAREHLTTAMAIATMLASLVVLLRWRLNSLWLIGAAVAAYRLIG
jgi:chromate transporter